VAIRIVPFTVEYEPAVERFNQRLESAGIHYRFPRVSIPVRFPPAPQTAGYHAGERLWHDLYVALDEQDEVRGGFLLQYQDFIVNGELLSISNYQIPLSEGTFDKRYGYVGLALIKRAMEIQQYLFGLGIGGYEEGSAKLMKALRWKLTSVPFYFKVVRPACFLRNISFLRRTAGKRLLLDVAALSGAGWVGIKAVNLLRSHYDKGVTIQSVDDFDERVNDLWDAGKGDYPVVAVRDLSLLRRMYPAEESRFHRLYCYRGNELLGWVVCLDTKFTDHKHFGAMRLGSIVDCFARLDSADAVIAGATRFLEQRGVDLIVTNQANSRWGKALRCVGFFSGPSNFLFTASPALASKLGDFEPVVTRSHLNRGDADGPLHL